MPRLHLATLLLIAASTRSSLAFSPAALRSCRCSTVLYQDKAATSSEAATDSSYEALRRKFGLTTDSPVEIDGIADVDVSDTISFEVKESANVGSDLDETLDDTPRQTECGDNSDEIVEHVIDESQIEDTTDAGPDLEAAPDLGTTYFRKFSRYNVPLTDIDSITKDEIKKELEDRRQRRVQRGVIIKLKPEPGTNNEKGLFDVLFQRGKGMLSTSAKGADPQLEKFYSGRPFRWVTSDSYKTNSNNKKDLIDEDFVAAGAFWRMAANISQQTDPRQHYLALPETTLTVAQHLCDIINWYADYLENGSDEECCREKATVILRARLDTLHSNSIPVVAFTAVYHNSEAQEILSSQHDELPAVEATEKRTKSWVQRLLVEKGVCPFTKSNVKSGQGLGDLNVPVANIMYRHSNASYINQGTSGEMYTLMADTWESICDMIAAGPSGKNGVSSILLSAPSFDDNFALWAGPVFAMLEAGVGAIQAEEVIGVVCFHPQYTTPDGSTFPGFGHMHSLPRLKKWYNQFTSSTPLSDNEIAAGGAWQRRTPHAVINVLRAEQLEAAEGRRESGILYERNIRVLVGREEGVGCERLQEDLRRERAL